MMDLSYRGADHMMWSQRARNFTQRINLNKGQRQMTDTMDTQLTHRSMHDQTCSQQMEEQCNHSINRMYTLCIQCKSAFL